MYTLLQFLKALLYDYNLNCNGLHYNAVGRRYVVVCCFRQEVIVQVGLVCVDGCGVGGIY